MDKKYIFKITELVNAFEAELKEIKDQNEFEDIFVNLMASLVSIHNSILNVYTFINKRDYRAGKVHLRP